MLTASSYIQASHFIVLLCPMDPCAYVYLIILDLMMIYNNKESDSRGKGTHSNQEAT